MKYIKFNLSILSAVFFSNLAVAGEQCEVIANQAAAVYAYCPAETSPDKMSEFAAATRDKYMNQKLNQVHVYLFDSKNRTPKTSNAFFKMSDKDVEKHQIGILDVNKNTGHKQYLCRKSKGKKLENCESFLK
jgi:hypothetical protein